MTNEINLNETATITLNMDDLKATRKRSAQREWLDSFEPVDVKEDGSFDVGGPAIGAAIVDHTAFGFADLAELKSKVQSSINGATQANKDLKFKVHVYASDSLLVIRLA